MADRNSLSGVAISNGYQQLVMTLDDGGVPTSTNTSLLYGANATASCLAIGLNVLEVGTTAGNQVIDIKSHDLVDGGLKLAGTLVTSSAAELNILDGATATAAEINYLDITTLGTAENSKAFTRSASGTATFAGTTFSDLGAVITVDINGGTVDGAIIGGASAAALTCTAFTSTGIDDNSNSLAMTIDSSENIGIGTTSPDGRLHIHTATAGTFTANAEADDLVIENSSSHAGMTIVTEDGQDGIIYFSSPSRNGAWAARILGDYNGGTDRLQFGTHGYPQTILMYESKVGINEPSPQDTLEINGTVLVKDKLKFTQDDGNEFIDSQADGYLDIGATTAIRNEAPVLFEDKIYFTQTDAAEYIDSLADGFLDYGAGTAHRFLNDIKITQDSDKLMFGAGDDASVYYDGTHMIVDPQEVGSGNLRILGDGTKLDFGNTIDDYTIQWNGSHAVHTITAGSFKFNGGDLIASKIGIGTSAPDGTLHALTATAGTFVPEGGGDDFIIENNDNGGMTIVTPDANDGIIYFSSPARNGSYAARILGDYNGGSDRLQFGTYGSPQTILMYNGKVGINNPSPAVALDITGKLYVSTASAGTFTAESNGDDVVIQNDGNVGITIVSPDANDGMIYFSSPSRTGDFAARILGDYNGGTDRLQLGTYGNPQTVMITDAKVGINQPAPESILHLGTATEELEFVDAGSSGASGSGSVTDWIEVQVGDVTGYIKVYNSK